MRRLSALDLQHAPRHQHRLPGFRTDTLTIRPVQQSRFLRRQENRTPTELSEARGTEWPVKTLELPYFEASQGHAGQHHAQRSRPLDAHPKSTGEHRLLLRSRRLVYAQLSLPHLVLIRNCSRYSGNYSRIISFTTAELAADRPAQTNMTIRNPNTNASPIASLRVAFVVGRRPAGSCTPASLVSSPRTSSRILGDSEM